jgi:hypothetical protein
VSKILLAAKIALVLGALSVLTFYLQHSLRGRPWDVETYYYAAMAAQEGLDPYSVEDLVTLAHRPVGMPYFYPPAVLLLFAPLTQFPVWTVDWVWRAFTLVLLVVLLVLCLTRLLPRMDAVLLWIAVFLGFDAAAFWLLKTGNIAVVEAVLIWTALTFYLARRFVLFTLCIVLASVFKMTPIIFLVLLFVPLAKCRERLWLAGCGLAALCTIVLVPVWVGPVWARDYFHHLPSVRPTGFSNPSALGFFDAILATDTGTATNLNQQLNLAFILWAVYAIALAAVSFGPIRRSWERSDARTLVFECVYVFVLISPRPMIYSYLLLIPPAVAFGSVLFRKLGGVVFAVAFLVAPSIGRKYGVVDQSLFWDNFPFFTALGIWLGHVWLPSDHSPTTADRERAPRNAPKAGPQRRKRRR